VRAHFTSPEYKKTGLEGRGSKMRLGTAVGCVSAMEAVNHKSIPGFTVPFCIIHGTDDAGVKFEGSQHMLKTASTPEDDKELHPIEGSFHESLADPLCADECIGHWMKFLQKRLKK
jgi:alpha-beta hydrolase superfamily lysophospholipase